MASYAQMEMRRHARKSVENGAGALARPHLPWRLESSDMHLKLALTHAAETGTVEPPTKGEASE